MDTESLSKHSEDSANIPYNYPDKSSRYLSFNILLKTHNN